jgi:Zn-dependent metalloprotease
MALADMALADTLIGAAFTGGVNLKIFRTLLAVLPLIAALGCAGCAGVKGPPAPVAADISTVSEDFSIGDLYDLNQGDCEVIRDPVTDLPRQIDGKFSTVPIFTAEDAVKSLASVRSIMRISGFDFTCTNIDDSRENLRVFELVQLYEGIPVSGGRFKVIAQKADGQAAAVLGTYQQGVNVNTEPALSEKEARGSLSLPRGQKIASSRLVIHTPPGKAPALCWEYEIKAGDPLDEKLVYVNAASGAVVAETPLAKD